jgi:hypothetical protein
MRFLLIGAGLVLLALPVAAQQQQDSSASQQSNSASQQQSGTNSQSAQGSSAPASKATQQTDKQPDKPAQPQKKSESEQNPFPEAQSEEAAHQAQPSGNDEPSAPTPQNATPAHASDFNGQGSNGPGSTAGRNPFPESESEKAQKQSEQTGSAPATESDTPDADSSSSRVNPKLLGLSPDDKASGDDGAQGMDSALAKQDTRVGMFYLQTGDFKGAYSRFAEAAKVDPGNADAVFGLAEAARRLNHRDEALRNYRLYLSALPDGPRAKDARKALKEMGADPNS